MGSNAILLSDLKLGAIVNTSSGGCDLDSGEKLLEILNRAGLANVKSWCGGTDQMERFFAEAATEKLGILIVLGGDGTIRAAAQKCGREGPHLLPLPGGTMNMLPRALYGELSWEDALNKMLAAPSINALSGGRLAGRQFFVAAIVGAPALWVEPRESIREGDIVGAIKKGSAALQRMFDAKVQYLISEQAKGEAEAIAVICPLISKEMADAEQALEVAVIDVEGAAEMFGLATAAAFGKWRDDKNIILTKTRQVTVRSSKDIPAILDGERVNLGRNALIEFVPKAVNVIVAADNQ